MSDVIADGRKLLADDVAAPTWSARERVRDELADFAVNHLEALLDIAEAAGAVREHDDNDPKPLRPTLEAMYGVLERLNQPGHDG